MYKSVIIFPFLVVFCKNTCACHLKKSYLYTNQIKYYIMKKLQKDELKKVNGGMAPKCCIDWDPIKRRCEMWDGGCLNP